MSVSLSGLVCQWRLVFPQNTYFLSNKPNFSFLPQISHVQKNRYLIITNARHPTRTESNKVRQLRLRKKFNGTTEKPRLSIFCSGKHLYAQLVDDKNKKSLAFASTLQEAIRGDPPCDTIDASQRVGKEIVKACIEQNIKKIVIDRNGFGRGKRISAFEIPLCEHGLLPPLVENSEKSVRK